MIRILGIPLLVAALFVAGYLYGKHDERQENAAELAASHAKYEAQVNETARIQGEWDKAVTNTGYWKVRSDAAVADADRINGKLRAYAACRRGVPDVAAPPGGARPSGEDPAGIEELRAAIGRAREAVTRTASLDAAHFDAIRDTYNAMRASQCAASPASC